MGLGGYLTWTAAAREIRKKTGKNVKLMPVEQHGHFYKFIKNGLHVFENNNDFCLNYKNAAKDGYYILPMILNNPNANYCKKDTPEKAYQRGDKHIISQICEVYGIDNPELKCYLKPDSDDLWFKEKIEQWFGTPKNEDPPPFITIEPISKTNYTPNRNYSFKKWQFIVNDLKDRIPFVQVGVSGSKILEGVIDWTGKTSFKNTAAMIGYSKLFLSAEGGLVHAATAFDTKSIVIITGYQSEKMVAYPQNININISTHGPCGLKKPCPKCKDDVEKHDWKEIVKIIEKELGI